LIEFLLFFRIIFDGTPATKILAPIDFDTSEDAPTTEFSPISTDGRIVAFDEIHTPSPIFTEADLVS
jgi:hypothetical protein